MMVAVSVMAASCAAEGFAATPGREWHRGPQWARIMLMSRFPTELRRWRTARRMSQLELAIRAGTTQRHVSFIEQGRSRPGRNVVVRLAESLDLTLRERNELLLAA